MANTAPREALLARWTELVNDPSLRNLPYKIELNATGKIEMSPATNRHGILQGAVYGIVANALPAGTALVECAVLTDTGVRVADVAWMSAERSAQVSDDSPYLTAPEICIEVVSPSNTAKEIAEKIRSFLAAGAVEVWTVTLDGAVSYYGTQGLIARSAFVSDVRLPSTSKAPR